MTTNMWWFCPNCSSRVDFANEVSDLFDYYDTDAEGEAMFDPKHGVTFHTITCPNDDCGAYWVTSISKMYTDQTGFVQSFLFSTKFSLKYYKTC